MEITWNPWHGCHKKSEGCLNCYMFRIDARYERDVFHKEPLGRRRHLMSGAVTRREFSTATSGTERKRGFVGTLLALSEPFQIGCGFYTRFLASILQNKGQNSLLDKSISRYQIHRHMEYILHIAPIHRTFSSYPHSSSWDAANMDSVNLAQKLGYHLDREYMSCNCHTAII